MHTRLSIIIVSYNSSVHLENCLASLTRSPPAVGHEIVIVDNASPDGTADVTRARWPAVRVLDAGGNLGFARGNNLGIRHTFGELILLLNPDTIVPPGAIDTLVTVLDGRPDAAAVGPRLVDGEGWAEVSFGRMISPLSEFRQKALVRGQDRRLPGISQYVERATRRARTVDWVSAACLLVRRTDAEAVGLLDERYFMYAEDVDFCAALRSRGRRVLFTPAAEVTHLRGKSAATAASATRDAYRRSQLAFYAKHHPLWVPALRLYLRLRGELPRA